MSNITNLPHRFTRSFFATTAALVIGLPIGFAATQRVEMPAEVEVQTEVAPRPALPREWVWELPILDLDGMFMTRR